MRMGENDNMEPIFENRFRQDKDYLKKLFSYIVFTQPRQVALYIFLAFVFLIGIMLQIFPPDFLPSGTTRLFVILPAIALLFNTFQYYLLVNTRYKQVLELNNGEPVDTATFVTEDGIVSGRLNSDEKNSISFAQVKRVIVTKEYFHLVTNAKIYYSLKTDGFVKGTAQGFLIFLKKKGFKI